MKLKLIEDGNLAAWLRVVFILAGVGIIIAAVDGNMLWPWLRLSLFCIGFVSAAIGGYASQAHALRVKPFGGADKKVQKKHETDNDGGSTKR